jgi:hypothetical protein
MSSTKWRFKENQKPNHVDGFDVGSLVLSRLIGH